MAMITVGIAKKTNRTLPLPASWGAGLSSRLRYRKTHHSRNASTATNTGAARRNMRTYRSWISWPWVLTPCCAQLASSRAPTRSAAAPPKRRRICSGHRELVDHPDGEVVRPTLGLALRGARLPAGHRVGAGWQREHPGDSRSGAHLADLAEV